MLLHAPRSRAGARRATALALLALAGACGDGGSTAPGEQLLGTWALASVDGVPLPVDADSVAGEATRRQLTSGELRIITDSSGHLSYTLRAPGSSRSVVAMRALTISGRRVLLYPVGTIAPATDTAEFDGSALTLASDQYGGRAQRSAYRFLRR